MTSNHTQDWNNYWQGRSAKTSGNALLGVGIENNEVLSDFWESVFRGVPKSTKLVDFACGAGSVLVQADKFGLTNLTGLDVSSSAIDVLKTKLPDVTGVVGQVDNTPFEANSFDMVVSQFGFEYAGGEAEILATVHEMGRILKPEGKIALIVHIRGGAIANECLKSLEQIKLILQSGFFNSAADAFEAVYKAEETSVPEDKRLAMQTMSSLNETAEPIMAWLRLPGAHEKEFGRFAYHLLESTHKLLMTYRKYSFGDCLSWLDGMKSEVSAYEGRMLSMTHAAMSEDLVVKVQKKFKNQSLKIIQKDKLCFIPGDLPAAWILKTS